MALEDLDKFPCRCGHRYNEHEWLIYKDGACSFGERFKISVYCTCSQYTPDNLKYLENLNGNSK